MKAGACSPPLPKVETARPRGPLAWKTGLGTIDAYLHEPASRAIAWGALALLGLGIVALVAALVLHARTRRWKTAEGRVVISEPGFALVQRFQTDAPRNERVARIVYEFSAAGKLHRSGRILDAGDPPEDDIERLLGQYTTGSAVKVQYDPADPSKSALEINGPPKDLALGCLAAIAILVVAAAILIWLIEDGIDLLRRALPDAIIPGFIALSATAIIFLLCFVAGARRVREIAVWPTTPGKIVQSGTHRFQLRRDRTKRTTRGVTRITTAYMPVVEYEYRVGGADLRSRSIWADTEVSGSEAYARSIADRYPVGRAVTVRYDPLKPTRAAIEKPGRLHWLFLVGAIIAAGGALFCSGLMH